MTALVVNEIVGAVDAIKGPEAAGRIRRDGVQRLHDVIDAREVTPLRDRVLDALRMPLLEMAVSIGRGVLGWDHDFYVDDYLILRVNFPFEVARRTDAGAENPGVGRLSPSVRDLFKSRKTIDPVYDPRGYHRGMPPAAWAHGPHLDSWAGHSRDGRNIWWAIGPVPPQAGMVLYPERAHQDLPPDPRTLYLKAGFPLPPPTCLPLDAGEMLIFDPGSCTARTSTPLTTRAWPCRCGSTRRGPSSIPVASMRANSGGGPPTSKPASIACCTFRARTI